MSIEATHDLKDIYAPVTAEIEELGAFLRAEFRSPEPYIHEILEHVARFRGKQIRPALLFLTTKLSGGEVTSEVVKIGGVLELIHTATLVHDDLLDDARLRRNMETVHRRWGERPAILIGDFIYSRAFQLSTEVPGMAQVLSVTTHTICEGELLQIGLRHDPDISEDAYYKIIRKKTAVLYAVSCELGGVFSGLDPEQCDRMWAFGMDLGMAFQIIDDCLDYAGEEEVAGKSLGTDLRKGKVTLPLIYLRDSLPEGERVWLRERLAARLSPEDERRIQDLVRTRGVLPEALSRAQGFVERARKTLAEVCASHPQAGAPYTSEEVRESLERITDYILKRRR